MKAYRKVGYKHDCKMLFMCRQKVVSVRVGRRASLVDVSRGGRPSAAVGGENFVAVEKMPMEDRQIPGYLNLIHEQNLSAWNGGDLPMVLCSEQGLCHRLIRSR